LTAISAANAAYTFNRKRPYRLFESSIDASQNTPSAQRVQVDASPAASSPLRFLTNILGDPSAESRAHPDPTRDVWEISIWDPYPICLQLFCLFSPGHVLVYWLFLPTAPLDPRPSVTIFTTLLLEALLSSQLYILQSAFSQQEKDTAIIQREVMREYDTKFVHPRLNPLVRDVGTQYTDSGSGDEKVDTYTPTVVLKRGFRTNPNPNYAKHVDPENSTKISRQLFSPAPSFIATNYASRESTPLTGITPRPPLRQPQFRQSMATVASPSTGDGGSLGVFSHANSPLKKATSMYDMHAGAPRNSFAMAAQEIRADRERSRSPTKRHSEAPRPSSRHESMPLSGLAGFSGSDDRRTSVPGAGMRQRPGLHDNPYNRGPSRF
jgi:hypothetical protein